MSAAGSTGRADGTGTIESPMDAGEDAGDIGLVDGVDGVEGPGGAEVPGVTEGARSVGTVAAGLLMLLGVAVMAIAVLPQPRWDLWLVGVAAVLGLSLVLLLLAVLPRARTRGSSGPAARPDR